MKKKRSKSKKSGFRKGEESFVLIEASKISRKTNEFLHYKQRTTNEKELKGLLSIISRRGLEDFCCSVYQPSFINSRCERIKFVKVIKFKTRKSLNDWIRPIRRYYPQRYSRIATKLHYAAILGVIMKELVDEGYDKVEVWNAFCNEKERIKDFLSKDKSKRKVDLFYNLIMKQNILLNDEEDIEQYWITNRDEKSMSYLSCEVNEYAKSSQEVPLVIMDAASSKNEKSGVLK